MRNTLEMSLFALVVILLLVDSSTVAFVVACWAPKTFHQTDGTSSSSSCVTTQQTRTASLRLSSVTPNNNDNDSMFSDEDCLDLCPDWENDDHEPPSPKQRASHPNVDKHDTQEKKKNSSPWNFQQMMRLEMAWELRQNQRDCNVEDIETCGDSCVDCVGVGVVDCRFCHGRGKLHHLPTTKMYGSPSQNCPVCRIGKEVCKTCRGSGRVADWTSYSTSN